MLRSTAFAQAMIIVAGCSTGAAFALSQEVVDDATEYVTTLPQPDAAAMSPETVPGFETASPPETAYANNPAAMDEAAAAAVTEHPAAQAVIEGMTTRPLIVIDPNDPLLQHQRAVESNAEAIAGTLQATYSGCQDVTLETPVAPTTESCFESRTVEPATCQDILDVTVDVEFSCNPGSLFPEAVYAMNGSDSVRAQAYCEPIGSTTQRLRAMARGGNGSCRPWSEFQVPSGANSDWIDLGYAYPHWNGSCRQTGVFLGPSAGCVMNGDQEICDYNVWFGSDPPTALLLGRRVNLHFERARPIYTVTDTWSGGCDALAAQAAPTGQTVGAAP